MEILILFLEIIYDDLCHPDDFIGVTCNSLLIDIDKFNSNQNIVANIAKVDDELEQSLNTENYLMPVVMMGEKSWGEYSYYKTEKPDFITSQYSWPCYGLRINSSSNLPTQSIPAYDRFFSNKRTVSSNPIYNIDNPLSFSPKYYDLKLEGGIIEIEVKNYGFSGLEWTAKIFYKDTNWITITEGKTGIDDGKIKISYQINGGQNRVGRVLVFVDGNTTICDTAYLCQANYDQLNGIGKWEFVLSNNSSGWIDGWRINSNDILDPTLNVDGKLCPYVLSVNESGPWAGLLEYVPNENKIKCKWTNQGSGYIGSHDEHWNISSGSRYNHFENGDLLATNVNNGWYMLFKKDTLNENMFVQMLHNKGGGFLGGWPIGCNDKYCTGRFTEKSKQLLCFNEIGWVMIQSINTDRNEFSYKWYNQGNYYFGDWFLSFNRDNQKYGYDFVFQVGDVDNDGYDEILLRGKYYASLYKFDLISYDWISIWNSGQGERGKNIFGEWEMSDGDEISIANYADFEDESVVGELSQILNADELLIANKLNGKAILLKYINGNWITLWKNNGDFRISEPINGEVKFSFFDSFRPLNVNNVGHNGLLLINQYPFNENKLVTLSKFVVPALRVFPKEITVPTHNENNRIMIFVENNCPSDWDATTTDPWLHIIEKKLGEQIDTLIVEYDFNIGNERIAYITFSSSEMKNITSPIVTIKQQSPELPIANIPGEFGSLQEGINYVAEQGGGIVLVAEGTYYENIKIPNNIWLIATGDASNTIINGTGKKDVVDIQGIQYGGIVGFTIQGGEKKANYAGINFTGGGKGAIICKNIIRDNNYGIRLQGSVPPLVMNNTIVENEKDGVIAGGNVPCVLLNNIIVNNKQNGISVNGKAIEVLSHNNVYGNKKDYNKIDKGVWDISVEPDFINFYNLSEDSPCKNAGLDLDGSPTDLGAYGANNNYWIQLIFDYILLNEKNEIISKETGMKITLPSTLSSKELITLTRKSKVNNWNNELETIGKTWEIFSTTNSHANLEINYSDYDILNFYENSLKLYKKNKVNNSWDEYQANFDVLNNLVIFKIIENGVNKSSEGNSNLNSSWTIAGIKKISGIEQLPNTFILYNNYPNPFNPNTTIKYFIPEKTLVTLKIYDILGQEIKTLVNEEQETGFHNIIWNGINNNGQIVSSGIYICRMVANNFSKSIKMIFLK